MIAVTRNISDRTLKTMSDIDVLAVYRQNKNTSLGDKALAELFNRHDNMLRNLASKLLEKRPYMNTVEDCLSTARYSAMIAYNRFDFTNKTAKLSTYVYSTVKFEMLTQADQESFVKCPSQMREFRVYYNDGYAHDPEKKLKFEQKWGLLTQEAIDEKKKEVEPLLPSFLTLCDPYYNTTGEETSRLQEFIDESAFSEETLAYLAEIDNIKKQFNEIQKSVFHYHWYMGCTIPETAEYLNTTVGKVISAKRGIIRAIENYKRIAKKEAEAITI